MAYGNVTDVLPKKAVKNPYSNNLTYNATKQQTYQPGKLVFTGKKVERPTTTIPSQNSQLTRGGTPTQYQVDETIRKAINGEQLMKPTQEKMDIYNQYKAPDFDQYRTESATIDDIAKKYGFDYSRDYAKRQAEAEAQAKRNANADAQRRNSTNKQENLQSIDNNLFNMADSLDRNYFQQYMQQAQGQTNTGMNAGIAADQDLRLAMSRQAEMGSAYRDANLGRMQENNRFTNNDLRLAEEMGLINQQALARTDSLYNDRLQQGFQNAMSDTQLRQNENMAMLNNAMQLRGQNIQNNQFDRRLNFDDKWANVGQQNWEKGFDRNVFESDRGYDRGVLESDRGYNRGVFESDRAFDSGEKWREADFFQMLDGQNSWGKSQDIWDRAYRNRSLAASQQASQQQAQAIQNAQPNFAALLDQFKSMNGFKPQNQAEQLVSEQLASMRHAPRNPVTSDEIKAFIERMPTTSKAVLPKNPFDPSADWRARIGLY